MIRSHIIDWAHPLILHLGSVCRLFGSWDIKNIDRIDVVRGREPINRRRKRSKLKKARGTRGDCVDGVI